APRATATPGRAETRLCGEATREGTAAIDERADDRDEYDGAADHERGLDRRQLYAGRGRSNRWIRRHRRSRDHLYAHAVAIERGLVGRDPDLAGRAGERDRELVDLTGELDASAMRVRPVGAGRPGVYRHAVRLAR